MAVEDNGPGIVKEQIRKVFGKLLYGSKFHRLQQTPRPAGHRHLRRRHVRPAHHRQARCAIIVAHRQEAAGARRSTMPIDTREEQARRARRRRARRRGTQDHGTRVEIEMEARYQKGLRSVDDVPQADRDREPAR